MTTKSLAFRTAYLVAKLIIALACVATSAQAQTNSWTDGNGKWETPINWSLGTAPSTNNISDLITNAGNNTVTIDVITTNSPATMTINNLNISSNTLRLSNTIATTFHVLSALSLDSNATLLVNNAAVLVDGSLGVGAFGSGNQLIITNGGQMFIPATTIGGIPGFSNSVVITGPGSLLVATNSLNIRNSTPGTAVAVANGGKALLNNVVLGNSASADGNIVLVTDAGSSWSNSGTLSIGGSSAFAQFIVSNGASAYSSIATIGSPGGANHSALVTGSNSVWYSDNRITLGTGGPSNSLVIQDGGAVFVTNTSHTGLVTVNAAALVLGAGTFKSDNLVVTNGGAVQYNLTYLVDNGTVTVAGGNLQAGSNLVIATTASSTGTVVVVGGSLVVTNGGLFVGNDGTITSGGGVGLLIVSNGTLQASTILLGSSAGGQGDMILDNGGTISCPAGTNCVLVCNDFGQPGGNLAWDNGTMYCGQAHPGAYTLDNGTASCLDLYVGYDDAGTMTVAGGALSILSRLIIGQSGSPISTGAVWMTGGQLTVLNNYTIIGNSGVGQLTLSNGTMTTTTMFVGNGSNPGSLTVAGGTMTVLTGLTVGDCGGGMMGFVTITGGNLFVTNAAHNATLDVRSGSFIMTGGAVVVDRLVMTNACGLFHRNGGTLQYSQLVLDPSLSAVGDGIPNSWKQQHGLDPFDPNLANEDPDGDGVSNLREYQLGTDPSVSSSPFRITATAREGNNIRVTWATVGGMTNMVQVSSGTVNGSYTNDFSNLSPQLIILGATVTTTNYLDLNGATIVPSRYYRIRVVP